VIGAAVSAERFGVASGCRESRARCGGHGPIWLEGSSTPTVIAGSSLLRTQESGVYIESGVMQKGERRQRGEPRLSGDAMPGGCILAGHWLR
jgi:hypothetical protein